MTAPLDAFLSFIHAIDWLDPKAKEDKAALHAFFDGQFGDPVQIALGKRRRSSNGRRRGRRGFPSCWRRRASWSRKSISSTGRSPSPACGRIWESAEADRRVRCDHRQSALGPHETATGRMVRRPPPRDRHGAARRRPQAHDRGIGDGRRSAGAGLCQGRGARRGGVPHGPRLRRLPAAVRRRHEHLFAVRRAGDGSSSSRAAWSGFSPLPASPRTRPPRRSSKASRPAAGSRRSTISRTGAHGSMRSRSFPTSIAASSSASSFSAHRREALRRRCAFFLQDLSELSDPERCFPLTAEDFARVNPNTGTAPIFRTRRDALLTTAIYARLPVLVDRSGGGEVKAWPVRYATMFHMTNDSHLFRTRRELEEREGAYPVGGNRFRSAAGDWVPLYEGKMVQAFDHRAASVVVNPENQHRPGQPASTRHMQQHQDPNWSPVPQFWVLASEMRLESQASTGFSALRKSLRRRMCGH